MAFDPVPEGKYVEVGDDLELHYHDAGEGEAVLFIHGSGPGASGWSNFRGNYPAFVEAGYRCLIPDTLGYGYSSMPVEGDYGLANLSARYKTMLDSLGITKVHLVGNSQGGAIAMWMALEYPDLVQKLILMAPGGLEEREVYMEMEGIQAMMKSFFAKGGVTKEGMRSTFELQLFDKSLITDEIIEQRFAIATTQPKAVIARMKVDYMRPRLKDIQQKTLCLWGSNDKFCPVSGAMYVAKELTGSKVVMINSCGHWVMVEHPALFNRMCLDFLKDAPGF